MDLYKGIRLVSFTSAGLAVATFFVTSLTFWWSSSLVRPRKYSNDTCFTLHPKNGADHISDSRHGLLIRSCIVVGIVSVIQFGSAIGILNTSLQGLRQRAKIWFCVNAGLSLTLFFSFIILPGNGGNRFPNKESFINCKPSMNFIHHLDSFYFFVYLDFVIHFLTTAFSLLIFHYDRDRDYEFVPIP